MGFLKERNNESLVSYFKQRRKNLRRREKCFAALQSLREPFGIAK